jgi:hypothetical protein
VRSVVVAAAPGEEPDQLRTLTRETTDLLTSVTGEQADSGPVVAELQDAPESAGVLPPTQGGQLVAVHATS